MKRRTKKHVPLWERPVAIDGNLYELYRQLSTFCDYLIDAKPIVEQAAGCTVLTSEDRKPTYEEARDQMAKALGSAGWISASGVTGEIDGASFTWEAIVGGRQDWMKTDAFLDWGTKKAKLTLKLEWVD